MDHREQTPLRPRHHSAEDASKTRTGHGPDNMATLRNLAINTLRAARRRNITTGIRHASYEPFIRPLDLLGIM